MSQPAVKFSTPWSSGSNAVTALCNDVALLGGLMEQQLVDAMDALLAEDAALGHEVLRREAVVCQAVADLNRSQSGILTSNVPANDLRILTAISKLTIDLAGIGDDAARLGELAVTISAQERSRRGSQSKISRLGRHVTYMLRDSMRAFQQSDAGLAFTVAKEDVKIDREYGIFMRRCVSFLMQDERTIPHALHLMMSVRCLDRIGHRARNIAEHVIYLAYADMIGQVDRIGQERWLRSVNAAD